MVGTEKYSDEQKLYILRAKDAGLDNATIVDNCRKQWKTAKGWTTNGVKYIWNKYKYADGWVSREPSLQNMGSSPPSSSSSFQKSPPPPVRTPPLYPTQQLPQQHGPRMLDPAGYAQNIHMVSFLLFHLRVRIVTDSRK
jgi:hypothetical protein